MSVAIRGSAREAAGRLAATWRDSRSDQRIGLLLAVLGLIAGIAFALVPPGLPRAELTWTPQGLGDRGALELNRGWPERLELRSYCSLVRAHADGELALVGDLSLRRSGEDLTWGRSSDDVVSLPIPDGNCEIVAGYSHGERTITLTVGDRDVATPTGPPRVTEVAVASQGPLAIKDVQMTTRPVGVTWSWARGALGVAALLLAGWAMRRVARAERGRWRLPGLPRLRPVDAVVAGCLGMFAILVPPLHDDGWVLARSGMLPERWAIGNLFSTNDAWLPQGFLYEVALGELQRAGLGFVHLRLVIALLVWLTWVVLRARVLEPVVGSLGRHEWPIAAAFLAGAGAYLTTIRAEPPTVLFLAAALACLVSMEHRPRTVPFTLGMTFCGLAVSTHQSGVAATGVALMLMWRAFRSRRPPSDGEGSPLMADRRAMTVGLLVATTATLLYAFSGFDVGTALQGAGEFSHEVGYAGGLTHELSRYDTALYVQNATARSFFVLLVLVSVLFAGVRLAGAAGGRRLLWHSSLAILAGLVLTSSKWQWHLAVYTIPVTVLLGVALAGRGEGTETSAQRVRGRGYAVLTAGLTACVAATLTRAGAWGERDLGSLTWSEFSDRVSAIPEVVWYAAVIVAAGIGTLADRERAGRRRAAVLAIVVLTAVPLVPLTANLAWIADDATRPAWSSARGNVDQLAEPKDCGALADTPLVTEADPLRVVATPSASSALQSEEFPRVAGLTIGPLGHVPVWGSWFAPRRGGDPDASQGLFFSPTYALDGAESFVVWSASGVTDGMGVTVIFTDGTSEVGRRALTLTTDEVWTMHEVVPPAGATEVKILARDGVATFGGWVAASAPTLVQAESAEALLSRSSAYTGPFELTRYPCLRLPVPAEGYWPSFDYVIPSTWFWATDRFSDLTLTSVGCSRSSGDCVYQVIDRRANVDVRLRR